MGQSSPSPSFPLHLDSLGNGRWHEVDPKDSKFPRDVTIIAILPGTEKVWNHVHGRGEAVKFEGLGFREMRIKNDNKNYHLSSTASLPQTRLHLGRKSFYPPN